MILAYHVILSTYGFWLPNDQRGSWSDFVRSYELYRDYGKATKVNTRHSVARTPYDPSLRRKARQSLLYPPVVLTGVQARAIGRGFAQQVAKSGYIVHACAILPDHCHLVIGRHKYLVEQVVNLLKGAASCRLIEEGLHPFQTTRDERGNRPSAWAEGLWKVYLDSHADVARAVRYVEENPLKDGLPCQRWSFVKGNEPGPAGRR